MTMYTEFHAIKRLPVVPPAPPPDRDDKPVLPTCKHCGSIPLRCKQPKDCKWGDLHK